MGGIKIGKKGRRGDGTAKAVNSAIAVHRHPALTLLQEGCRLRRERWVQNEPGARHQPSVGHDVELKVDVLPLVVDCAGLPCAFWP